MCKFMSAILLKSGDIHCNPAHTDSHEDLIRAHGLRDDALGTRSWTRIEYTPGPDPCDLDGWTFTVDEQIRPDWLDQDAQDAAERKLLAIVRRMVITDKRDLLLGGCWLFGPGSSVRAVRRGRIRYVAKGAVLTEADLTRANLRWADLGEADLGEADLTRADLTGAVLNGAVLNGAVLNGAVLTEADLTRANLYRADLTGANLYRANLTRANLTRADLTRANLTEANLTRANLTEADLGEADLTEANLTEANLTRAYLYGANLTGADRFEADPAIDGWAVVDGVLRREVSDD